MTWWNLHHHLVDHSMLRLSINNFSTHIHLQELQGDPRLSWKCKIPPARSWSYVVSQREYALQESSHSFFFLCNLACKNHHNALKEIWLDFIHVLEFQAAMASINAIGCVRFASMYNLNLAIVKDTSFKTSNFQQ
jgi:hypothetical protein